jgi:hypothetical protein
MADRGLYTLLEAESSVVAEVVVSVVVVPVMVVSVDAQPLRSRPIIPAGETSSAIAALRAQLVASTRRNRSRARTQLRALPSC